MSLEVLIPKGFSATPSVLVDEYLKPMGVQAFKKFTFKTAERAPATPTARVCWGIEGKRDGLPELNGKAATFDKLEEFQKFRRAGIPCPQFWEGAVPADESLYPILGRTSTHAAGQGIKVFNSSAEARTWAASKFYTRVIPSTEEYRIWVFRTKHLGSYIRTKRWPVKREGFGRNWWNGWAYNRVESGPPAAIEYAKIAIATMQLDFAGVDVLKGRDGKYYVLEINTAPGAESYCRRALELLAGEIKTWYRGLEDDERW